MTAAYYTPDFFASTYGSGSYNTSNYNGTDAVSGTTNTGTGGASGTLSNTGVMIGLIVGVAALTLLVAMIVRVWRRPAAKMVPVEEPNEDLSDK